MKRILPLMLFLLSIGFVTHFGCVQATAPDVYINTGPPPEDVNSAQVPATSTHEEACVELEKAYRQIRYLEHENHRLAEKVKKEKERGDEYKKKYKRLKDKYDD
ncbi:MAG: hypothetical protein KAV82_12195 [Phycisphaerae bacterium]|nr:hypothetical protein [Phycisphaerae bacterium]